MGDGIEEVADGMALWEEHKPRTGEDWVAVAERFIADDADTSNSSPLFAAVVLAVSRAASLREALEDVEPDYTFVIAELRDFAATYRAEANTGPSKWANRLADEMEGRWRDRAVLDRTEQEGPA